MYVVYNLLGCLLVFLVAIGMACQASFRKPALITAVLAVVVGATPLVMESYRIAVTRDHLAVVFDVLSNGGPPFPKTLEPPLKLDSMLDISHGYWVSRDQQKFEVYYHVSSDSCAMAYPRREWEWRRNKYSGPSE